MPNAGSENYYAEVINYTNIYGKSKLALEKLNGIIGNHYYRFSDGWGVNVLVKEVDRKEAEYMRKNSKGFYGYDWMIDSILSHGKII
jgi:hypothetical protein